jgi:hypothetical protein
VATFREVTTDFGAVIDRVNVRFGTAFARFEHSQENVRRCFETMEAYWRARVGSGPLLERKVGRPSLARDSLKEALRPAYGSDALARIRERAESLYLAFPPPERDAER